MAEKKSSRKKEVIPTPHTAAHIEGISAPEVEHHAGDEGDARFVARGNLGQAGQPVGRGDGEPRDLSRVDVRLGDDGRGETQDHMTAHLIDHQRPRAFVRHVQQVGTGARTKQFASQMR